MLFPLCGAAQGIVFETGTFAEVLAKAKAEDKLVFVDFYTDWCGPCKKMTSDVFTRDNVGALFNASFISYKIDAEKGEGPEIAKKYGVTAYPTMFFLDGDGKPVHRILGAKDEDAFLGEVRGLEKAAKYGGIMKMNEEFGNGRSDEPFLKDYFRFQPESSNLRAKIAERYIRTVPEEVFMSEDDGNLTFLGGDGGIIEWIKTWDDDAMYRMLDLLVKKASMADEERLDNKGKVKYLGAFSPNYNLGMVFSVELKGGEFIQKAIDSGDEALLEKSVKFQQDFRRRLNRWVNGDGDVNIMSGRRIFFASPEFIRLSFMVKNGNDPERFKREVAPYMERIIAENPLDSIKKGIPTSGSWADAIKEDSGMTRALLGNALRAHDISMDTFTAFANYYWRIMPSDKATKKTVAAWLNYTAAINPYYVAGVTGTVPLLIKVGHRQDAAAALQRVVDMFGVFNFDTSRYTQGVADMIVDIKNDKI